MSEAEQRSPSIGLYDDPFSRRNLENLNVRVLEAVRKMTPEEGLQALIKSGIYTPEGKLTKEYGG